MTWDSMLMPAIAIGLAAIGGYGHYVTTKADLRALRAEADRRFADGESDRKDLRARFELLDRESVKKGDLTQVKGEIIDRIREVEHTFRNEQAKAINDMRDMIKQLLDRVLGARS